MIVAVIDKIILTLLILAIAGTTLAHGAVEPWSIALFGLIVIALMLLAGAKFFIERKIELRVPAAALPLSALVAFGVVQSIAFSASDGRVLSLSLDVEATRQTVAVIFFVTIVFLFAADRFSSRESLQRLASLMVVYGLALAVFALIQHFTWDGKFYWMRANTLSTSPFGPFVNHNHFAGYMEMLIPIPLALAITKSARAETRMFNLFAASIMCVALLASLSRGGMISVIVGVTAVVLLGRGRKSSRTSRIRRNSSTLPGLARKAVIIAVVFAASGMGLLWVGPERLADRISQSGIASEEAKAEPFYESRGWIWEDTLRMIGANPVFGVGLGAYETAYSIYRREDRELQVSHAHNDYLQIVANCGIVGGLIALWFIASVFRAVWRGLSSRDSFTHALAVGSGSGILAMMVHSLVDFNLQLLSNALMFLLLVATASNAATLANAEQSLGQPQRKRVGSEESARESVMPVATVH